MFLYRLAEYSTFIWRPNKRNIYTVSKAFVADVAHDCLAWPSSLAPHSDVANSSFCILYMKRISYISTLLFYGKETFSHLGSNRTLYRYIDDVLSINNPEFENYLGQMYPAELEIKDTTESPTSASYLDLLLSIWEGWSTSHFQSTTSEMISISQHHKLPVLQLSSNSSIIAGLWRVYLLNLYDTPGLAKKLYECFIHWQG